MYEATADRQTVAVHGDPNIRIKTTSNDIMVYRSPLARDMHVSLSEGPLIPCTAHVDTDGTNIMVNVTLPPTAWFTKRRSSRQVLQVILPANLTPRSFLVETSSGSVTLLQPMVGSYIGIRTASGTIRFTNLEAPQGELVLQSTSGTIIGDKATAARLTVTSCSGLVKVNSLTSSEGHVATSSGLIALNNCSTDGKLQACTESGHIDMQLSHGTDAKVHATSQHGSVRLHGITGESSIDIGTGAAYIEATSESGRINICW